VTTTMTEAGVGRSANGSPARVPVGLDGPGSGPGTSRSRVPEIAVGVLVLVVSGLAALWLFQSSTDRTAVLALAGPVERGEVVTAEDLVTVEIAADEAIAVTRPGDVDAGALLHLLRAGIGVEELAEGLNTRAGLLGLSGVSADMRELLKLEAQGHAGAALAISAFCRRARKYLGAYLALLGGADAILLGGGIGEHAPQIRARILAGMDWCGVALDDAANAAALGVEGRIGAQNSATDIYVIPVNEELLIAREVRDHCSP